jgi:hypothetical protein
MDGKIDNQAFSVHSGISVDSGFSLLTWKPQIPFAPENLKTISKGGFMISPETRKVAGAILVILPTVMFGGVSVLTLLIGTDEYMKNQLRQDLWRAGHAHAGVFLLLTLIALRYVDEASLSARLKWFVRLSIPAAAILLPLAFFLSVLSPEATRANPIINLAYVGAVVLAAGVVVLGIGLIRRPARQV